MSSRKKEKKRARRSVEGLCALTLTKGTFVDCHIVPQALTSPSIRGNYFVEAGRGLRATKRWSSWYDARLVTRSGEDILARYDNWAITALRAHELVWSGWRGTPSLAGLIGIDEGTGIGIRIVRGLDKNKLRLFVLSLLWRAAASTRPAFSEVELPSGDLERLRLMVLTGDPGGLGFYPAVVTQMSTIGPRHNMAPERRTLSLPSIGDVPAWRFYFDGLVVNVFAGKFEDDFVRSMGHLLVGAGDQLGVSTITYEKSLQLSRFGEYLDSIGPDLPDWAKDES